MKTELRIKAKNIKKSLEIKSISKKLVDLIRLNKSYIDANNVMLFYPKKYEVDLRELFEDSKNFFLPRVENNNLLICPYDLGDELNVSKFNVLEPVSEPVDVCEINLIIVPALFIDKNGYRLGYGGGYYDRLLQSVEKLKTKTICAIPKELVVENLPKEEFDIAVDEIISI